MRLTKGYMLVPSTWRCQKFSTPCVHKFGNIIFKFYLHVQDTIPEVCWLPNYKELGVHFEISLKKRSEICLVPRIFRLVHDYTHVAPFLREWREKKTPWIKRITKSLHSAVYARLGQFSKTNEVIEGSDWSSLHFSCQPSLFWPNTIFWKILLNSKNCFEIKLSSCDGFFAWMTYQ